VKKVSTRKTAFLVVLATTLALQINYSQVSAASALPSQTALARVEANLNKGVKPTEKDFDELGQIVAAEPNNFQAHLILGMAYEAMGLPEQSLEQYKIAINLAPNDPRPLVDLLKQRIRTKQTENISVLIAAARSKFPGDADVMFLSGYDALNRNAIPTAEAYLSQAYRINPHIPFLKSSWGETKLYERNWPLAYKLAAEEIKENPNNPKAYMVAGLALAHMQRFDQACDMLGKACIAMPDRSDLTEKLARLSVWSGRYKDAIAPACLYLAIKANPHVEDESMHWLLLDCLRHTQKDQAMATINEISEKFEPAVNNPYFHNTVGEVLKEEGWQDAATAQFKTAVKLMPSFGRADFNLAIEYENYVHDYTKALEYYKKAQVAGVGTNSPAVDYANRLEDRLAHAKSDVAWRLKDLLTAPKQP